MVPGRSHHLERRQQGPEVGTWTSTRYRTILRRSLRYRVIDGGLFYIEVDDSLAFCVDKPNVGRVLDLNSASAALLPHRIGDKLTKYRQRSPTPLPPPPPPRRAPPRLRPPPPPPLPPGAAHQAGGRGDSICVCTRTPGPLDQGVNFIRQSRKLPCMVGEE